MHKVRAPVIWLNRLEYLHKKTLQLLSCYKHDTALTKAANNRSKRTERRLSLQPLLPDTFYNNTGT